MSSTKKALLITATALVLTGCIMFAAVMTVLNWDFKKISTEKYQTNNYEIAEEFKNILVTTNVANVIFVASDDGKTHVTCYEEEKAKHCVKVNGDTLEIKIQDNRKWIDNIGIAFETAKITVSIPKGEYGDISVTSDTGNTEIPEGFNFESVTVKTSTGNTICRCSALKNITVTASTGNILIENASADTASLSLSTGAVTLNGFTCENDLSVKVSTGKTSLNGIKCKSITTNGSTGKILLTNVIAEEKITVQRSTGDVRFDGCDAKEIFVKTDTGDVSGSLLSEKVFFASSDTGKIDLPKTATGGKCEITTDTGNIKIIIK